MKKLFTKAAALAAAMMLSATLAGCGSSPVSSSDASTPAESAQADSASSQAADSADAPDTDSADAPGTDNTEALGTDGADSDMDYVKNKGTLVVGITDFAPMDYRDENGEWIGFDADMAKAFAESLGVAVEFVEIDWDNKILELDGKTIDCVWNGMTLTAEVTSAMECSKPYCNNAQVIVVPGK